MTVRGSLIVHLAAEAVADEALIDDLVAILERHPAAGRVEWFDLPHEATPGATPDELVARATALGTQYGRLSQRRPRRDVDG